MIIESEKLKEKCGIILSAVDSNELSILTETLELKTDSNILYMNVTNKEYYARVKVELDNPEDFHVTVNANTFLKLISQITTDKIELKIDGNVLLVYGNGSYKLPLIFEGDELLNLPEIKIENKTNEFKIGSEILNSILVYNSKEIQKGVIAKPVQKMFYIDSEGAITFTSGACINNFNLPQPIRILLNERLVKLFKLFKRTDVNFELGYDKLSDSITQTKVKFTTDDVEITAILSCDDTLLDSVPVNAIRGRATDNYPHEIVIDRLQLIETLNRLLIFEGTRTAIKPYGTFEFEQDKVRVWDISKQNNEYLSYISSSKTLDSTCSILLDLVTLKTTLDSCTETHLTFKFGNTQAVVLVRNNIINIIPEIKNV